jgi:diadenosine tetraphosphatase ApaH/serine/threonine PP2A family protein phosphatase
MDWRHLPLDSFFHRIDKEAMPSTDVALISDVHGNLQALTVVLADIASRGITELYCLGDIVGYGGNPAECVAMVRATGCKAVTGNHDSMASRDASPLQDASIQWARKCLTSEQLAWLESLPYTLEAEDFELAHASLWNPPDWQYIWTPSHADMHFQKQRKAVSFIGHTHRPLIWLEGEVRPIEPLGSEDMRKGKRHIVNVGSVGQPRDENPMACYVIYSRESHVFRFRRLDYDIAAAQAAIMAADLPPRYAHRLEFGK